MKSNIDNIQELYNKLCLEYQRLSVKVYLLDTDEQSILMTGRNLNYKGLYIEYPFRKIYLNTNNFTTRTIYHEIFHHLNPDMLDGDRFEKALDSFIENTIH